jgi:hypothetical protein
MCDLVHETVSKIRRCAGAQRVRLWNVAIVEPARPLSVRFAAGRGQMRLRPAALCRPPNSTQT